MTAKIVEVGEKKIGTERTFVIAEIGSNHGGDLNCAKELIDAACEAGADAVKFQSININELYLKPSRQTIELHKKIDFDERWHAVLSEYCRHRQVTFFSSPTYLRAVDLLEDVNVPLYKLASAQIGTFPQIVRRVAATRKPVIFSTGLVVDKDLDRVMSIFAEENNDQIIVLHCNSIYPTSPEDVKLAVMDRIRDKYDCLVGFSDHTVGIDVSIAAVARGAKVIEKHFTLDKQKPVPDAAFSLDPSEFGRMVAAIRVVEKSILNTEKTALHAAESSFKEQIVHRLVSAKILKAGELIQESDFSFLRHPDGIDCFALPGLIDRGARYLSDIPEGTVITEKCIG